MFDEGFELRLLRFGVSVVGLLRSKDSIQAIVECIEAINRLQLGIEPNHGVRQRCGDQCVGRVDGENLADLKIRGRDEGRSLTEREPT